MGWTADAIARIQQQGRYRMDREGVAENDGRKALPSAQYVDPFAARAEGHEWQSLTQGHMTTGRTRHGLHVRVNGEELGISPPWDEVTIAEPRLPLRIETRTSLRQAPPMQPVEFRTWEWRPEGANQRRR